MNKLMAIMLTILTSIIIAGGILYFTILNVTGNEKSEPSIDDILDHSVDIEEITTNIKNNDFIRISFKIQANSSDAKNEIEKRDFQVKNIIIKHLSGLNPEDLQGAEGKSNLEEVIKSKLNDMLENGKVVQVYITSSILQ
jgi:flagellar protein FliL